MKAGDGSGGWRLVRRVPSGDYWHPGKDDLAGTETYGPARILTDPKDNEIGTGWSINFERAVPGYNEVLFATGDNKVWLITTKDAIGGSMVSPPVFYEDQRRPILKSSKSPSAPHMTRWYNRQPGSRIYTGASVIPTQTRIVCLSP